MHRNNRKANSKVLLVFGTRPEAVKMAPIVQALSIDAELEPVVCLTGQHRELVEAILPRFGVVSDFDLDVMAADQTPSQVAAAIFERLPEIFHEVRPRMVLVQGDTTTAMAAAISAHYARLSVGHVEAGLRTGQLYQPFPEEANRRIISAVTSLHFAPTPRAADALRNEGIRDDQIRMTGNPVVDALQFLEDRLPENGHVSTGRRILVTAHRRESFGEPLKNICRAVLRIVRAYPDVHVVYPVHPNPNVLQPVNELLGSEPRVCLVKPMEYLQFIATLRDSYIALSDSGGVQEEAPVLGIPVLVMRDHTERMEAVEAGSAELVGTDEDRIFEAASRLLSDPDHYARRSKKVSPFGDGKSGRRIVNAIHEWVDQR